MPIFSRSNCCRRSGGVSTSRLPLGQAERQPAAGAVVLRIVARADRAAAADGRHADAGAGAQKDQTARNIAADGAIGTRATAQGSVGEGQSRV